MYYLGRSSNHTIYGIVPETAWNSAVSFINSNGRRIQGEHGAWTKEVENLQIIVERPLEGWPIKKSGWSITALDAYARQFFSPDPGGFDYTYGERLAPSLEVLEKEVSSVELPCPSLWRNLQNKIIGATEADTLNSRRFTIPLLRASDLMKRNAPCMVALSFLIRDGKINATAFFRSHDILRAWPANIYGIAHLMEHLATAAKNKFTVGRIQTYSVSAHIYE